MGINKKRIIQTAVSLAAISTLVGFGAACTPAAAGTDTAAPPAAGPTESTAPLDPAPESVDPNDPTDEPSADDNADEEEVDYAFGDTITYKDGLQVTVGKPTKYRPSRYSSYDKKADSYVSMTVTVKNGTKKRFDPNMFSTSATSGDKEMEEVYDSAKSLEGAPDTKVLKGHTVKFKIGYGVKKGQDFVLAVTPDFDHDEMLYVS